MVYGYERIYNNSMRVRNKVALGIKPYHNNSVHPRNLFYLYVSDLSSWRKYSGPGHLKMCQITSKMPQVLPWLLI